MSRFALFAYGARLAVTGGRGTRLRVGLMAGGIAIGVTMLLGLFSVLPAVAAHHDRAAGQQAPYDRRPTTRGAHVWTTSGFYRGATLTTTDVFVDGPVRSLPPGLSRLPAAGEVAVSPALARLLRGPRADELRPRLPGRVTATIGRPGLLGPDELTAWVGVAEDPSPAGVTGPTAVRDFGRTAEGQQSVSSNDRVALGLAFVGLLIPVLVLIATLTRLSAATRERRLAAIRLVGATRRQTRWLAAAETGVAAAPGVVGGLVLFLLLRGPVAALMPVPSGVFATDVAPPLFQALLVLLGLPLLAVVTAVLALRRVVTSPLGVSRRAAPRRVGWWRLVPLTVGLLMLVGAWLDRKALLAGGTRGAVLLVGGAGLSLVGLAVAAAAVARLGGLLLRRHGPGTASQLAGRRLESDPAAAARVLTGAMLVVAVVGWLLGFLPLLDASQGGATFDLREKALRPGTMTAQLQPGDPVDSAAAVAGLARLHGVTAVAPVEQFSIARKGADNDSQIVMVADCGALQAVTRSPLRGCGTASAYRVATSYRAPGDHAAAGETWQILADDGPTGAVLHLPDRLPVLHLPAGLQDLMDGLLITPELAFAAPGPVPDAGRQGQLFIGTDGRPGTEERVRSALWRNAGKPMTVREEQAFQVGGSSDLYRRAALAGVVFALLAAGLSFSVATADALLERRRGLAALVALGTPVRVLRRSVLLQTAVPLLLNIALATGASIVATVLYLNLGSEQGGPAVPLPWTGWSLIATAAVAAVLLATTLTLPFVRAVARPGALRAE